MELLVKYQAAVCAVSGGAAEFYQEALTIRRTLANTNREAYQPDVATTLNSLVVLYGLEPFWRRDPAPQGDQMARILNGYSSPCRGVQVKPAGSLSPPPTSWS